MNINKVVIAGRLGRDPEMKTTPSGQYVTTFALATNKFWKDKNTNEKKQSTEWTNCVAWGRTAESIAKFFRKGKEMYIEGRLQTRSWDGQDGKKNYRTEVIVDNFQFVGSDRDAAGRAAPSYSPHEGGGEATGTEQYPEDQIAPEDIPF